MQERLRYLFERYTTRTSTPEELDAFMELVEDPQNRDVVQQLLDQVIPSVGEDYDLTNEAAEDVLQAIFNLKQERVAPVVALKSKIGWMRWVAAAVVVLAVGITVFVISKQGGKPSESIAQGPSHDIAPGSYKARLKLADGSVVVLDSASTGELTRQGNTAIINKGGQLIYKGEKENSQETVYNTLSTANGESYSLLLSDGTRVWLNAASSIQYPVAFTGKERRVQITGEAYFEVKHNSQKPFKVIVNGMEVEDLGTAFNINAYADEPVISATLISGKVRILSPAGGPVHQDQTVDLNPGEQALVTRQATRSIRKTRLAANELDKITSWKNNEFNFTDDTMETIMRQLARWYNIQPILAAPSDMPYTGRINRNVPLSEVLKMFERVGYVKFEIKGRVVRIIPTQ